MSPLALAGSIAALATPFLDKDRGGGALDAGAFAALLPMEAEAARPRATRTFALAS